MVSGKLAHLDDPLILYLSEWRDLSEVRQLPESRRIVRPAVVKGDGSIHPPGSRTVWPVSCKESPQR
jgi:hypothetical protein